MKKRKSAEKASLKRGYGLIGKSLTHSYSREIHEALGEYSFDLWEITPEELDVFLKARDFKGAMITIPYKKEALDAADKVSAQARAIGAANILYFDKDDHLCADNTDYSGFVYMLDRMGLSIKDKRVLILGDGATSGTVRHAVFALGAGSIKIASRKPSIKPVINHPSKVPTSDMQPSEIQKPDIKPSDMPLCDCQIVGYDQDFSDINIVINTTSVGMFPGNGEKLINLEGMSLLEGVIDLIYNPFATALLLEAQDLNIKTSNGFPMLVAQATKGAELFLGRLPKGKTWEEWNETLIEHFEEKYYNKVLIGMPGSGKTTLGKALAQELNREFQDIDHIIEAREARSIPDIFKEEGEPYFRQLEVKVAKELGEKKSLVIATGGGMILQKEAMDALRQNGEIIWVKAPLDNLAQGGRPLSLGIKSLEKMWGEREPLYNKYANKIVYRGSEDG